MAKQSKNITVPGIHASHGISASMHVVAIAACSFEVQANGAIQLTPAGVFGAKDGRPAGLPGWKIDDVIAQRILTRLKAKQSRLVIDYEHQTLLSETNGQPAPAAGWFNGSDVEWRSGEGFFVVPEWTAAAKAHIEAKEYLYSSPVLVFNRNTGEVLDIRMSALTNDPAIDGMGELEALAAAKFSLNPEETPMDEELEELLKLLGLNPDANGQAALVALKAKLQKITDLETELETSKAAVVTLKAKGSGEPDPAKFVPVAVVTSLQEQLVALKGRVDSNELEDLVLQGIDEGKLVGEELQKWARSIDVAALKAFLGAGQAIAALKGNQTQGKQPAGLNADGELNDEAIAVCKQMGIEHEAYKKTLQEDQG